MSRGDWRTTGAYLTLFTVILVIAGNLIWNISANQTEIRIDGEQSTQNHIEYAEDRIHRECLKLEGLALRECIHVELQSAKEHNRAKQDLDAQQSMAL